MMLLWEVVEHLDSGMFLEKVSWSGTGLEVYKPVHLLVVLLFLATAKFKTVTLFVRDLIVTVIDNTLSIHGAK